MSIEQWIAALKASTEHETHPQASDDEIGQEEAALGIVLPPSYQTFLRSFSNGAFLYGVQEVAGVGKGAGDIAALQDHYPPAVSADVCTDEPVAFREGGDAPLRALYPFSVDGHGNAWCFVVGEGYEQNEYPVAYLDYQNPRLYGRLSGFAEWLGILVEKQEEVIRTIYEEDVIANELEIS